jgi:hypothetical protein
VAVAVRTTDQLVWPVVTVVPVAAEGQMQEKVLAPQVRVMTVEKAALLDRLVVEAAEALEEQALTVQAAAEVMEVPLQPQQLTAQPMRLVEAEVHLPEPQVRVFLA